jgi:23S rRNA (cytosine1962-C5)-methyltransferase
MTPLWIISPLGLGVNMTRSEIRVDTETGRALRAGYPLVPRDGVTNRTRGLSAGAVVDVVDGRGFAARGLYDDAGPAAVRILTRDRKQVVDGAFWRAGIERALELRRTLVNLSYTDAWRAVNGAGDGLPGLVVESYSSYAVLRLESEALRPHLGAIVDAVRSAMQPRGLYEKRRGPDGGRGSHLGGSTAPDALPVREGNLRFLVRLGEGEMTGFFLDMREGRRVMARYSRGKQVINCYSYTGALSLTSAAAGSPRVVSIDPSTRSIAWCRENFAANGLPPESHEFVTGDPEEVLGRISSSTRRFDLAVLDTPDFEARAAAAAATRARGKVAKKPSKPSKPARKHGKKPSKGKKRRMAPPSGAGGGDPVEEFSRGYGSLVKAAIGVLQPNGLLACTLHEKKMAFRPFLDLLRVSAEEAGVGLQILETHGLPADFPVSPAHPEGQYLKFLVCAIRR